MNTLTLNDGTVFQADVGFADGVLWCWLHDGTTLMQAFMAFSNAENTSVITFDYGSVQEVYEGFTQLSYIAVNYNGTVDIALKQPKQNIDE